MSCVFFVCLFISFLLNLQFSNGAENHTLSVLSFTPSVEDNGKELVCRAKNPVIPHSDIQDVWNLSVHCKLI